MPEISKCIERRFNSNNYLFYKVTFLHKYIKVKMSSRHYCFTVNLQDNSEIWSVVPEACVDEDEKVIEILSEEDVEEYLENSFIKYIIYQREVAPTTGRHHYQGYVEFKKNLTIKQAKSVLNDDTVHLEARKGTQQQAIDYVSKLSTAIPETQFTWGEPGRQGARTDIKKTKAALLSNIDSSTNVRDFAIANPDLYVRMHQGIDKLVYHHKKPRDFKTEVHIFWGVSDSGKTRKVYDDALASNQSVYKKPNGQWWDGYEGQDVVLIDDYDSECVLPFREFLQLNDRYPHQVPIKGAFRQFTSKKIVYTSNQDPIDWYPNISEESLKAFKRRITTVLHFPDLYNPPIEDLSFYMRSGSSPYDEPYDEPHNSSPDIQVFGDVSEAKLRNKIKALSIPAVEPRRNNVSTIRDDIESIVEVAKSAVETADSCC